MNDITFGLGRNDLYQIMHLSIIELVVEADRESQHTVDFRSRLAHEDGRNQVWAAFKGVWSTPLPTEVLLCLEDLLFDPNRGKTKVVILPRWRAIEDVRDRLSQQSDYATLLRFNADLVDHVDSSSELNEWLHGKCDKLDRMNGLLEHELGLLAAEVVG